VVCSSWIHLSFNKRVGFSVQTSILLRSRHVDFGYHGKLREARQGHFCIRSVSAAVAASKDATEFRGHLAAVAHATSRNIHMFNAVLLLRLQDQSANKCPTYRLTEHIESSETCSKKKEKVDRETCACRQAKCNAMSRLMLSTSSCPAS
jgi:hypothetical protein